MITDINLIDLFYLRCGEGVIVVGIKIFHIITEGLVWEVDFVDFNLYRPRRTVQHRLNRLTFAGGQVCTFCRADRTVRVFIVLCTEDNTGALLLCAANG